MASAPRPGAGRRRQQRTQAQRVLRITVRGETKTLCPDNIAFGEQIAVRKACGGLPFSAFWGGELTIGEDSLQIMWWLARRANGEPTLPLSTVLDEWPEILNPDDFNVELDEPDDEDVDPE
jgi:hypothetical protein